MQAQSQIDPAVVARVRKLLNLANNGAASESEQEQAQAHAERLMLEHNIAMATVEASHDTSTVVRRSKEATRGYAMYEWQRNLMSRIARSNFCYAAPKLKLAGRRWTYSGYDIIGREENVVGTTVMFDYLRSTIERLANEYVYGDYRRAMSTEAMSFKKGAADRIGQRISARHREALAEQKRQAQAARGSTSNALVPIMEDFAEAEDCANEDFRLNLAPGTTARNKFVGRRMGDALTAVRTLLASKDYVNLEDKAILTDAAREAAEGAVAAAGLDTKELERVVSYALSGEIETHIERAAARRTGRKPKTQKYRNWGRSYSRYEAKLDHRAYSAGTEAGQSVGLDKQAGHGGAAVKAIK